MTDFTLTWETNDPDYEDEQREVDNYAFALADQLCKDCAVADRGEVWPKVERFACPTKEAVEQAVEKILTERFL